MNMLLSTFDVQSKIFVFELILPWPLHHVYVDDPSVKRTLNLEHISADVPHKQNLAVPN